ncbi:MAG TPA: CoA transferase [Candidatus Limnocylindria bacterium]|nr:CoA transferase [Candidatus Limnocylindria bacterium]
MADLLEGVRVIDAANFIAGPVAATVMADFGADVIKVEPPTGDIYRVRGAGYPASAYNFPWIVDNRTKRSVAIDLRAPEGQALLHRLVREADVFVTNAPLDSRARLGVRYEDLEPLNPRLIYASITAYGETGAEASKPGFDSIALWARTGLMDLVRSSADVPPARSLPGMGDHPTGMSLFAAIMAGLYHRERTGRGTTVATSLMANGLWWNAIQAQGILCGTRTEVRPPREDAVSALANMYGCRDGRWFMLTITGDERHWPAFAAGIGRADLATDPRFAETDSRRRHARALTAILDEVFAARDWDEWRARLETAGIACGVVATLDDIPHDEQMRASGALVPIDDARAGAAYTVSSPIQVGGQPKVPPAFAPEIGEHTVEVLRAAGVAESEIQRLLAAGVIAQAEKSP